jgi:hypothetical protein
MRKLIRKIVNLLTEQPVIGNCKYCNHDQFSHGQWYYWPSDHRIVCEYSCKGKGQEYFTKQNICRCEKFPFTPLTNLEYLERKYASR